MRWLGGSFSLVVLALLGCTGGGGGGSSTMPALGDAGTPETGADAAVTDPPLDRTQELVDPRDLLAVAEQPPVPARVVFIEDSHLALGAGYDPEAHAVGPVCLNGVEVLDGDGHGSASSWSPTAHLSLERLVGFGESPLALQRPSELESMVEELNARVAIGIESDRNFTWGVAALSADGYAWSESPECEGVSRVVHQLQLEKRRYTFISLDFFEYSDRIAFIDAHGTDAYEVFTATGLERARLERELAEVAVVRVFHYQVGGDRASTEALLASHRCSVTELAACGELIRELDALSAAIADEPAPEPGNYHGWVPARAFEDRWR